MVFCLVLIVIFSVLARRLAGESISDMTYLTYGGFFTTDSINFNLSLVNLPLT